MSENSTKKYNTKNPYLIDFNHMRNNTTKKLSGNIQPYFSKIEDELIAHIAKATYVIGCVAWLTNNNIIDQLEKLKGVKIIVSKEEFISSKMQISKRYYYRNLRNSYDKLPDLFESVCHCCKKNMVNCPFFIKKIGKVDNIKNGGILTCGIVNNYSKMHHKFLIFFDKFEPIGVWTGSYNLSNTSNYSLENALYITDSDVINAYLTEFWTVYEYAENYDWESGRLSKPISC